MEKAMQERTALKPEAHDVEAGRNQTETTGAGITVTARREID